MRFSIPLLANKYPVTKQGGINDCAPAALHSIIKYYHASISRQHIQNLCNTSWSGTTLFDLKQAAEILGFRAIGATGTYDQLRKQKPPFIAHINYVRRGHYLVVYKVYAHWVLAGDPAAGLQIISRKRFEIMWLKRAVLLLWPTDNLPREEQSTGSHLKHLIRKESAYIFQGIFLGVVQTLLGLFIAFYIRFIIDVVVPSSDFKQLKFSTMMLVLLFLLSGSIMFIRQKLLVLFLYRAGIVLHLRFQKHLFFLKKRYFDYTHIGDTIVRLNDIMKIPAAVAVIFGTTIIDLLLLTAVTGVLFVFDSQIGATILLILPFNLIMVMWHMKKIGRDQQVIIRENAILQDKYIDTLKGIDDIISYNAQSVYSTKTVREFKQLQKGIKAFGLHQSSLAFSIEIFRSAITVLILLIGSLMVIQSEMKIGEVIACYYLISNILPALSRIGETSVSLRGAQIAWERLQDVWQIPKEKLNTGIPFTFFESLRITDGAFFWHPHKLLWQNINIEIKRGEMVALTGPSGSGKSTLLQVLHRKYKPNKGALYLDNRPVSVYRLKDYRRRITLVPQSIHIFSGTLLENILMGRPAWYIEDLVRKFPFSDWVSSFEHGLETHVGGYDRPLSGGEKQVLGLMRALYARPDILLIDEALNAVDSDTRERILYSLKLFALEGGVLICTHDKGIIAKMNSLYILDDGKILKQNVSTQSLISANTQIEVQTQVS